MNAAIICLGNRLIAEDDLGWRVFEHLKAIPLPPGIDLIDGGLCGINLLSLMEGRKRVVFADAVSGLAEPDTLVVLDREAVAAFAEGYGHAAGLPYLLHLLPKVCRPPLPEVALVGASFPAQRATVEILASRCIEIAQHGNH